ASPKALAIVTTGISVANAWYQSGVGVGLYIDGVPATEADGYTYTLNGNPATTTPYPGAPFDVPEGINTVVFTPPPGSTDIAPPPLEVKKDTVKPTTDLQPRLEILGQGETLSPTTCVASDETSGVDPACTTLPPTVVDVGGVSYSLTNVNATDTAGNTSATQSQTAVIVSGQRTGPDTFDAPNSITIVVGGPLAPVAKVLVNGVETTYDPGTPSNVKSVTIGNAGAGKLIQVVIPGSPGVPPVNLAFTVNVNDALAPNLTLPADIGPIEATGPGGAAVSFTVTATDETDPVVTPTCSAASGSTFPIGTTTVSCTVKDAAGNPAAGTFTVTVADTTPPNIAPVADIVTEATGPAGTLVSFTPVITDAGDATVIATCTPGSGSAFPIGTTVVSCTATDKSSNTSAPITFNVTVRDTVKPVLTAVAPISLEGNTIGGRLVDYVKPTATDLVAGSPAVDCSPASGSKFPVGNTTVTCTTTDGFNTASTSFTVTITDLTPPLITTPGDIQVSGGTKYGGTVNYTVTAYDLVKGPIVPVCTPASGTAFPWGATIVNCTATDGENSSTASFKVTVVIGYKYYGFKSPVTMGDYDGSGLNQVVNVVNGGRNVPFKWAVRRNGSEEELKDTKKVEIYVEQYKLFRDRFKNGLTGKTPLPLGNNPCADGTRVLAPIATTATSTGKTGTVKYSYESFNIGIQMPTKPATDNCFVAWTRVVGDTDPGIVALFQLS
ncbi:MAG: HYR domain-containing protein, partial [Ilumatobacteraceae bacterium]